MTEDAFLGGALAILQPESGYRAGLDAVLLAAALRASPGETVLDAGAGVGVAGLAAAHRIPGVRVTLVEHDPGLVAIAWQNIVRNGMSELASAVAADITRPLSEHPELHGLAGGFDHIMANPPFHVEGRGTAANNAMKATAHAMEPGALERWVRFMAAMARPGGTATLIHRPDALPALLDALDGRFGGAGVVPVHPHPGKPASRVLVRAIKGSRAPLTLRPGIVLHESDGCFRPEIDSVLRGGAALDAFLAG